MSGIQKKKQKSLNEILKEMDPEMNKEEQQKFEKVVKKILQNLQIDDPMTNMVTTFARIEEKLNYLTEARNILAVSDAKKTTAGIT